MVRGVYSCIKIEVHAIEMDFLGSLFGAPANKNKPVNSSSSNGNAIAPISNSGNSNNSPTVGGKRSRKASRKNMRKASRKASRKNMRKASRKVSRKH